MEPLALAPDNQAHQLDVSGSYDFAKGTRGTFKLGYSIASQTADFAGSVLTGAPAGVTDLGGQVAVKSARLGLSSRITPVLSVLADARYEDKDDRTAIALYNTDGVRTFSNRDLPNRKVSGKLQAQWQLTKSSRASLGTNYESIDRGEFTATAHVSGLSALRQTTNENTVFADVRRQLSDEFSGSVAVSQSQRAGSNWLQPNSAAGVTSVSDSAAALGASAIYMPNLADRQRNKVRLFADWLLSDSISLQFSGEEGRDYFNSPSMYGVQSSRFSQLGVDVSYAVNSDWNVNGSFALGSQTQLQARPAAAVLAFEDKSATLSMGVAGKASAKLDVGANWAYILDRNVYNQRADTNASAADVALLASGMGLPDTQFSQQTLRMFGKYALEKNTSVRLEFVHQTVQNNDWAWGYNGTPFVFSDGSTVAQKPSQNVNYLGATYTYVWP
jgi:MtrB/PioB family decaheme-associated outer membrane protein